ncbi:MAG: hypothetical protein GY765_23900, partial [bacterium]|nr:hypothetical protein [bacterium]
MSRQKNHVNRIIEVRKRKRKPAALLKHRAAYFFLIPWLMIFTAFTGDAEEFARTPGESGYHYVVGYDCSGSMVKEEDDTVRRRGKPR